MFGLRYLFGYDKEEVTKKELVILLKAELVPTLQERITQKDQDEDLDRRGVRSRSSANRIMQDAAENKRSPGRTQSHE